MTGEVTYLSSMAKVFEGGKGEGGFDLSGFGYQPGRQTRTSDRRRTS